MDSFTMFIKVYAFSYVVGVTHIVMVRCIVEVTWRRGK